MCNYEKSIWSESEETLDSTTGVVASAILTGIGYTRLKENLAAVKVKCMSLNTYNKLHENVTAAFQEIAEDCMNAVAKEEHALALERNNVIDGT